MSQKSFLSNFENVISDFIGLPVSFIYTQGDELDSLELGNFNKELYEVNKDNLKMISDKVKEVLLAFYEDYKNLTFKPIYRQILVEELAYSFIGNLISHNNFEFSSFIETLKIQCIKTYESANTEMGFIIFRNDTIDKGEFFKNIGLKYLPFKDPQDLNYLMSDKQTLKIVDAKSISIVIDSNYQVMGLAQKLRGKQSINDIMLNRHQLIEERDIKLLAREYYVEAQIPESTTTDNKIREIHRLQKDMESNIKNKFKVSKSEERIEQIIYEIRTTKLSEEDESQLRKMLTIYLALLRKEGEILKEQIELSQDMETSIEYFHSVLIGDYNEEYLNGVDFVYFNNKQIVWSSSHEYIISYTNGQWRLRNYFILRSILTNFVMSQYPLLNVRYIIEKIDYSIPRMLDLYNMVKRLSEKKIGSLICVMQKSPRKHQTIFREMLQEKKLTSEKFKGIIQTENGHPLNIKSSDPYLFELIASVDGAILLDYNLKILSFGEMISSNQTIDGTERGHRGARTLAAQSASAYGLGLKISEDGDMQVFENGKEIARV